MASLLSISHVARKTPVVMAISYQLQVASSSGESGVVDWHRTLVKTSAWDYVVVWKYGDDPTRFIEWVGCCCSGSCIDVVKPEEEKAEVCNMAPICRDDHFHFQHPVRTKACEALAQLPFALSLYSGSLSLSHSDLFNYLAQCAWRLPYHNNQDGLPRWNQLEPKFWSLFLVVLLSSSLNLCSSFSDSNGYEYHRAHNSTWLCLFRARNHICTELHQSEHQ
ncbi:Transcription factor bHLH90 [Glycine soja]|uniref:Transcription factor bHLH90 n=1 Tax=Glycine soja TaxID=3848 RepID=A0A445FST2_GLYSO|nr:Transcription factor bHLH90 [Glycine soja]